MKAAWARKLISISGLVLVGSTMTASAATTVVYPGNLGTPGNPNSGSKWFWYNDENDTIDNSLGTFVVGPGTPPLGTGSCQTSVTGSQRRNMATYRFTGTVLSTISTLRFSTYNPSAGNGGASNRSAYLQFNVDFDGSDTWQRRLVYVPRNNGTVIQDTWQEWDAINGGAGLWSYSGATWPPPGVQSPGTTLKSWSTILAEYPGVRIRVTDSFLGMRVGEPYTNGYTENMDAFKFTSTGGGDMVFNFETTSMPATGTVAMIALVLGLGAVLTVFVVRRKLVLG